MTFEVDYDELKTKLMHIVEDPKYKMYFHKNNTHKYRFNGKVLYNCAICDMKERRKSNGGDTSKKLMPSKLNPIQSAIDFKKQLDEVSEVIYQRLSRINRLKIVV